MGVELAKGIYRTPETARISVNPSDIRSTSSWSPLFGGPQKERIGSYLVGLAKQHLGWVAVSADRLFGRGGLEHFAGPIDGMRSKGYIELLVDKRGLLIEPTQELADFYMEQQSKYSKGNK